MATVGEVRKAWTVAKAAVGGMKAINGGDIRGGVRILPDALEVWGRGEVVRVSIGLGVGPVTVSGDTFAALVKLGKVSDEVAVEVEYPLMGDGPKAIRWNGAEAPTINGDHLPDSSNDSEEWYGPYPGESVKGAAAFASKGDMRPVLTAVAFQGDRIAATDSYRLAVERVIGGRMPGDDPVLVPARPLAAIGGKVDTVMIGVRDREVKVYGDLPIGKGRPSIGVEWCGTLIEGQFPKYDQLFPDPGAYQMEACFYPERGLAGVKAAADSVDKGRPAVLSLNGTVDISTDSPEGVSLPPVEVAGPVRWTGDGEVPEKPMRVGVNARYLLDAVKYLDDGGGIMYRAVSPLKPMLIERGARNGKGERQVLTMPLRLDD